MDTRPLPNPEDFPSEAQWLDLPAPEFDANFVSDTLQRVREDREQPGLPRALLDAWTVPDPSPDFVGRVEQLVHSSADISWQRMLREHGVPLQPPDFVERVLRAVRDDRERLAPATTATIFPLAVVRRRWLAAAALLVATAGAIWWTSTGAPPARPEFRLLAAEAATPDVWGTRLTAMQDLGIGYAPDDPLLLLGQTAGLREGKRQR